MSACIELRVADSWIPGAGKGLFAACDISAGTTVCSYYGLMLSTKDAISRADKSYLMRLGPQLYVDAKDVPECLARFVVVNYVCTFIAFIMMMI